MENILYWDTIISDKDAPDGETPTAIFVTEEVNVFLIWATGFYMEDTVVKTFPRGVPGSDYMLQQRSAAIRYAVEEAQKRRLSLVEKAAAVPA